MKGLYDELIRNLGAEFYILREASLSDIELVAGPYIAEGIRRLRSGRIERQPGFDGQYGTITILDKSEIEKLSGQLSFINDAGNDAGNYQKSEPLPKNFKEKNISPSEEAEQAPVLADNEPSNVLYGLNEAQWEAVSLPARQSPIAGPGTGKLKRCVLIAHLVEKCGISPQDFCCHLTNKAASECVSVWRSISRKQLFRK